MTNKETNTQEMSQKQLRKLLKKAIREYISNHKANDTYIKSKSQIYKDLSKSNKTYGFSKPTFYRCLTEMKCEKLGDGKFDFITDDTKRLDEILIYRKYNKRIYFQIKEPSLGDYLANKINEYYRDYKRVFYCATFQDLLICFFYENDKKLPLTKEEIIEDIKKIAYSKILTSSAISD